MLHTEVMFLWSNNLLFNQKIIILWVSLAIVQYNTILCKKDDNYFEVMINYIIAVTSCVQRINVMPFCSYQLPFSQMILIPSWIHVGLILSVSLTFVVCLLLQMKNVEKHHGKSKTRASANQTHPAWCTVFEFKSEHRVNPIWIHDKSNIIYENGSWQEPKHIVSPGMWG